MHCFILTVAPVICELNYILVLLPQKEVFITHILKCSATGISSDFVLYVAALVCRLIGGGTVQPTHLFLAQLVSC